jgi:hypothetical protein
MPIMKLTAAAVERIKAPAPFSSMNLIPDVLRVVRMAKAEVAWRVPLKRVEQAMPSPALISLTAAPIRAMCSQWARGGIG